MRVGPPTATLASLFPVAALLLCACSQDAPSAAGDSETSDSGPSVPSGTTEDTLQADSVSDAAFDTASDTDTGTVAPWDNPGCTAARNVVEAHLALDVEVDLTGYEDGVYAIRELITVTPEQAGNAVSFYGEQFKVRRASVGMAYDQHLATFCVGDFAAGDEVTVEVEYEVDEANENALDLPFDVGINWGLRRYQSDSGELVVGPFNEPYYAPFWLFVPQSLHRVSAVDDDSPAVERVALSVRVPSAEWSVVGPGGIGTREDNTVSFQMNQAMPLYAFSFAASPDYELFSAGISASGVEVTGAVFPGTRDAAAFAFPAAITTIDWMEQHIGPYDFGKSLVVADVPFRVGGMEHVGVIWLDPATVTPDAAGQFIVVHEMMHHWWGDNVRFADWPHFWLAEGFDEWSTNFNVMGELLSPEGFAARKLDYRTQGAELTFPSPWLPLKAGPLRFADKDDMTVHFFTDVQLYYTYGAAFLEMINQRLKRDFDTELNAVLAQWFEAKRLQSATTEEFLAFLQQATADDGDYWQALFDEWVYKAPAPALELADYTYTDGVASVTVNRLQGGQQSLPGLAVVFIAGDETFKVTVELPAGSKQAVASVALPVAPSRIAVDPDQFYVFRLEAAKTVKDVTVGYGVVAPPAVGESVAP